MRWWTVEYLNKMLNKVGYWGCEAESQEEALEKFHAAVREFCIPRKVTARPL